MQAYDKVNTSLRAKGAIVLTFDKQRPRDEEHQAYLYAANKPFKSIPAVSWSFFISGGQIF